MYSTQTPFIVPTTTHMHVRCCAYRHQLCTRSKCLGGSAARTRVDSKANFPEASSSSTNSICFTHFCHWLIAYASVHFFLSSSPSLSLSGFGLRLHTFLAGIRLSTESSSSSSDERFTDFDRLRSSSHVSSSPSSLKVANYDIVHPSAQPGPANTRSFV